MIPLIAVKSLAQESRSFVGLRSGISIPFGGYQEKSLDKGNFAQSGFNVTMDGAWFFSKLLGVGLQSSLSMNPVDVASLGRARMNTDPFLNDLIIRSEPYRIFTFMPGLYAQKRFGAKWSLNGKLLGGLLYGRTPYQLYKPNYYILPNYWQDITSAQDWKFSWQAGLGFAYAVSPCIGIGFDTDVLYDKLSFDFQTSSGIRRDEKTVAMINLTLGVRILL